MAHAAAQAKFRHSSRTVRNYGTWVKAGKRFAKDLADERRRGEGEEDMDPDLLEKAFDNPPNKLLLRVFELYLSQKCLIEHRTPGTGRSIHAAFADHWRHMDGDRYVGDYGYDEATDTVHGCPADSMVIKTLLASFTYRANEDKADGDSGDGTSPTRAHAVAMRAEHLQRIMEWSESQFPSPAANRIPQTTTERAFMAKHLKARAWISSMWKLWARGFETARSQVKHLTLSLVNPDGLQYFEYFLEDRKGYEGKDPCDKETLLSNRFNIYPEPEIPSRDMYAHILRWLDAYQTMLGRPLRPYDYLFPYISRNGTIDTTRLMTHDVMQRLLSEFVVGAGLTDLFTLHSPRRGAAQHHVALAPPLIRYTISEGHQYGGWAPGEKPTTLIKYIIDDIWYHENAVNDLLNPRRQRGQDYSGQCTHPPTVTVEEFRAAHCELLGKYAELMGKQEELMAKLCTSGTNLASLPSQTSIPVPFPASSQSVLVTASMGSTSTSATIMDIMDIDRFPDTSTATPSSSTTPFESANFSRVSNVTNHSPQAYVITHRPVDKGSVDKENQLPPAESVAPKVERKRGKWKVYLDQWYKPNKVSGIAMKDWPREFYSSKEKTANANLRASRYTIAMEWEDCGKDEAEFMMRYPHANNQTMTALVEEIRKRYGRHRRSKNGMPEERALRNMQGSHSDVTAGS
ncbi:hypothetical protein LshimejAT787_1801800 [Lyophyllum shimeji]|uniref:Uncharacterized protein n=1 Tax=Lyophyllum shimeji TaxID=47721 RepID=A0A9P3UTQ4_LYOSH|nr:hypothetical protein LshimejAT787_1801800 [Lyophyllum shimeji]